MDLTDRIRGPELRILSLACAPLRLLITVKVESLHTKLLHFVVMLPFAFVYAPCVAVLVTLDLKGI